MHPILLAAQQQVNSRIATLQQQLDAIDSDKASDTKSSAGDKFETSREMMQQQSDQLMAQQHVQRQHALALDVASRRNASGRVGAGSVVLLSNRQTILVATGLGKVNLQDGSSAMCISLESPLGSLLIGKQQGESINFRGVQLIIEQVA